MEQEDRGEDEAERADDHYADDDEECDGAGDLPLNRGADAGLQDLGFGTEDASNVVDGPFDEGRPI